MPGALEIGFDGALGLLLAAFEDGIEQRLRTPARGAAVGAAGRL